MLSWCRQPDSGGEDEKGIELNEYSFLKLPCATLVYITQQWSVQSLNIPP